MTMLSKVCEISEPERVFTGGGWAYRPRRAPGDPEGVALHTHIVASLSCGHRVVYELTLQQLVYVRCPTCAALAARLLSIGESLGGAHHATLEDGVLCLMRESRGVRTAVYLFPYAHQSAPSGWEPWDMGTVERCVAALTAGALIPTDRER